MHCGKVKPLQLKRRHKIKGINLLLLCNLRSKGNRRGSQVIVIHPGSRFIRIGKASDVNPVTVPCVVARKHTTPFVAPERVSLVSRPRLEAPADKNLNEDIPLDDPVSFTEDRRRSLITVAQFSSLIRNWLQLFFPCGIACDFTNYVLPLTPPK
jgi:hypothetical protein